MKNIFKHLYLFIFLSFSIIVAAQPENNDCNGVIDLGQLPYCNSTIYSNIGATPFNIDFDNEPNCFVSNPPSNDVWFAFTTGSEAIDYEITLNGVGNNKIQNIQFAIYRGQCAINSLALRQCATTEASATSIKTTLIDFVPNTQYYLRVDNFGGQDAQGEFDICIQETKDEFSIDEGGSQLCSGVLYDSGGPSGNYQNNENQIFTICPSEFHNCVKFELKEYNIGSIPVGSNDKLIFYNGATINSPVIESIQTTENNDDIHGGGGVCYTVLADDCLTIQFISDRSNTFEGFEGNWECSTQSCNEFERIKISGELTKADIEDAIGTPLSKVTVDTIICDNKALGTFNGGENTDLGIDKGLLLTTGSPFAAIGPNNNQSTSTINDFQGDNDLDILSQLFGQGSQSFDACVVELEVQVFSDELTFEYVFASEEYPEFVGREFNDIFAFLISGPGIDGIQEIANQKNLATLETGEFVQTNSVNHLNNWEYYRNNSAGKSIAFDGMTSGFKGLKKSLTASTKVIPCNTYRLKLAIADRGDLSYDSGVFISEISSGVPQMDIVFNNPIEYFIESCTGLEDKITLSLPSPSDIDVTYTTVLSGEAIQGVDYLLDIPEQITFVAGETSKEYSIIPIEDNELEGIESIEIQLLNETECGTVELANLQLEIYDKVSIDISDGLDTILACKNSSLELFATGASEYIWSPINNLDNPFIPTPNYQAIEDGWLYVKGSIGNFNTDICSDTDSVFIQVIEPVISIDQLEKENYCTGSSIDISASTNIMAGDFSWTTTIGEIQSKEEGDILDIQIPGQSQELVISQAVGGCVASDTVYLNVDDFYFPTFNFTDTIVCQNKPLFVVPFVLSSSTVYQWEPSLYLSDPNRAAPTIKPEDNIQYKLTATSQNGYCIQDTTINIEVIKNEIDILGPDTITICDASTIDVTGQIIDAQDNPFVSWDFNRESVASDNISVVGFEPKVSDYLIASISSGGCSNNDSIFISVDSLPSLEIMTSPQQSVFCKNEIVTLFTNPYVVGYYPDIEFNWLDVEAKADNLNLAINATSTRTYIRETINGLCTSSDSITVSVFDFDASTNLSDTLICKGDSIEILIDSTVPLDNISWDPFVCNPTECEQVVLAPFVDTDYQVVLQAGRCIDSLAFTIQVEGNEVILESDKGTSVPIGEEIFITANTTTEYGGEYVWYINGILSDNIGNDLTVNINTENTVVTTEIYSESGCLLDSNTITIVGGIPDIVFPNVFIPEASAEENRIFTYVAQIDGLGYERAIFDVEIFEVFNRWGQKVFDCQDLDCLNQGWDGRHKGKLAPAGVYSYLFKGTLPNGTELLSKGTVTLVR